MRRAPGLSRYDVEEERKGVHKGLGTAPLLKIGGDVCPRILSPTWKGVT